MSTETVSSAHITSFNRILDDKARIEYSITIAKMIELVPNMMARKIAEANIQQAFVFDTVQIFASLLASPKILCVGSYEDTAAAGLKKIGFKFKEIDPVINCDLNKFFRKWSTRKGGYDIIFSTSVIEHVQDDELFIRQIVELLAPGGTAILTCDFNDQYKPGDKIPLEDCRFYTEKDFKERLLPLMKDCDFVGTPDWNCQAPDFSYGGCSYTFATLVFQKSCNK